MALLASPAWPQKNEVEGATPRAKEEWLAEFDAALAEAFPERSSDPAIAKRQRLEDAAKRDALLEDTQSPYWLPYIVFALALLTIALLGSKGETKPPERVPASAPPPPQEAAELPPSTAKPTKCPRRREAWGMPQDLGDGFTLETRGRIRKGLPGAGEARWVVLHHGVAIQIGPMSEVKRWRDPERRARFLAGRPR